MIADRFWELLSKKIFTEANEDESKEFEELLSDHPDWKNTAETLFILAHQSQPIEKNIEAEQAFEKHIDRLKKATIELNESYPINNSEIIPHEKTRYEIKKWSLPIGVLAIIVFVFFIFRNNILSADNASNGQLPLSQVTTKPGSKTQIQLPDGSTVWLNASSNLTYYKNFDKNFREVNLTREAFFDVVKDPPHP